MAKTIAYIRPLNQRSIVHALGEMWQYRSMFMALSLRNISVRYKQSVIGMAWVVLQPVMTTVIFSVVFGVFARFPSDDVPYPVFVFSGLLTWQMVSRIINEGTGSLLANTTLITKVYFPRMLIPLSTVVGAMVDYFIAMLVLIVTMLLFGVMPSITILCVPLFVLAAAIFAYGISLWLSPLNALYRDIGHAIPYCVQVIMYMSPVIYPISFVPDQYKFLMDYNPIATLLNFNRWAIIGGPLPNINAMVFLAMTMLVILFGGIYFFQKSETKLVDCI